MKTTQFLQFFMIPIAIFLFLTRLGFTQEYYRMGQSYRSLAMGNTGVASSNDGGALYYNPAAMANIKTFFIDIPTILIEASDPAISLVQQARSGGISTGSQTETQEFLDDYIGKNLHLRAAVGANAYVNYTDEGFTLGVNYLQEVIVDISIRNPVLIEAEIFERWDVIQQVGVSVPLGTGEWVFGATYRTVNRKLVDTTYGISNLLKEEDLPLITDSSVDQGTANTYDYGILYRWPNDLRMSIGLVMRNVGGMDFGDAGQEPQQVDMGFAVAPEFGIIRWTWAIDFRDLTYQLGDDKSTNRRIHLGTELGVFAKDGGGSLLSFRAGVNQSYFTYGAEIALGHSFIIGLTAYSEELGGYAGQREDKRKILYLQFGI